MSINWLTLSKFVPTYGNYGGPSYSGGVIVQPGQTPDYSVPPVDPLDALFREHDIADQTLSSPGERAQGDLALLQGISALPDEALTPEGHLYAGAASLAMIGSIVLRHDQPELLPPREAFFYGHGAVENIASGGLEPDAFELAGLQALSQFDASVDLGLGSLNLAGQVDVPTTLAWFNDLW